MTSGNTPDNEGLKNKGLHQRGIISMGTTRVYVIGTVQVLFFV